MGRQLGLAGSDLPSPFHLHPDEVVTTTDHGKSGDISSTMETCTVERAKNTLWRVGELQNRGFGVEGARGWLHTGRTPDCNSRQKCLASLSSRPARHLLAKHGPPSPCCCLLPKSPSPLMRRNRRYNCGPPQVSMKALALDYTHNTYTPTVVTPSPRFQLALEPVCKYFTTN
jgi:hypothetical protein